MIKDAEGEWITDKVRIEDQFTSHFGNLFRTDDTRTSIKENISNFEIKWEDMKLQSKHIRMLNVEFSNDEIKSAAFSIASNKSPGPDGIPGAVFQKLWTPMAKDVLDGVRSFFNNGNILKEWNHTFITLIPKISNPVEVGDFRPISLCNVVYKIVSKCLTIRLRSILPDIVGPYQSAFLKG